MKKKVLLASILLGVLILCPMGVFAAETTQTASVPIWLCIPFAGLLLCIAIMPLVKGEWWENHQPHAVIFWILTMVIPFAIYYGAGQTVETVLECTVNDYLTFIILLFGLFCVSGNITMEGDFAGSPRINVGLLAWNDPGKLYRYYRSQYAHGTSCFENEFMEKKKGSHYGFLHFSCFKYGRNPDTDRRSPTAYGIYAGRSFLLEPSPFSCSSL